MITACTPNIPTEIVLVDLPGLLASGNKKAGSVMDMIKEQITASNTCIVAAGKTDNDSDVDEGLALAQEIDPQGKRTLRLYTFWKKAADVRKDEVAMCTR